MNKEATPLSERIYGFLLEFYPKEYKEEFGDEMKYLFSESCKDAYAQAGWIGIATLWGRTSIDWLTSIVNEHLEDRKEEQSMASTRFVTLRNAALTGFLMVIPFVLLEAITTSGFVRSGFPLALYILLWLFAAIFVHLLAPVVQTIRAGNIAMANSLFLVLKVVLMALIAWAWIGLVIDQWPCFLGIPNCD
jgi:hypothetical protein